MLASDAEIMRLIRTGQVKISPEPTPNLFQPASLDVHLDRFFRVISDDIDVIDPAVEQPDLTRSIEMVDDEPFVMEPMSFVLGSTLESISIDHRVAVQVDGRSSVGRIGVLVHATAGWIDPGFSGTVTLELMNLTRKPVKLYPGMRIGQMIFSSLLIPADVPYGAYGRNSSYQHQGRGPLPSAMWRTWNPVSTYTTEKEADEQH